MASVQRRLFVYPERSDDPYLNLLHLAPRAAGWEVGAFGGYSALETILPDLVGPDVLHLHWTEPLFLDLNESEATARLDEVRSLLDGALLRGVTVIWTVHDLVLTGKNHKDLYTQLWRDLAARATQIHTFSESTATAVQRRYGAAPEKLKLSRRASYSGIYDRSMSRDEARTAAWLTDDEFAVMFFGRMSIDKNLDTLCRAVQLAAEQGRNIVLILMGKASPEYRAALEAILPKNARVLSYFSRVADGSLQKWFGAADVLVVPHQNAMNAGITGLAATFGLPVIVERPEFHDGETELATWVNFYEAENSVENLAAVLAEYSDEKGLKREAAQRWASQFTPYEMSRDYLAVLNTL